MSSSIRTKIQKKNFMDLECLKEAVECLKNSGAVVSQSGNKIVLKPEKATKLVWKHGQDVRENGMKVDPDSLVLSIEGGQAELKWYTIEYNLYSSADDLIETARLAEKLTHEYDSAISRKMERLEMEALRASERKALDSLAIEEKKKAELQYRRELNKLESMLEEERNHHKAAIQKKVDDILSKADERGFRVQKRVEKGKQVYVLVRG